LARGLLKTANDADDTAFDGEIVAGLDLDR
jgi:hypothetical protein